MLPLACFPVFCRCFAMRGIASVKVAGPPVSRTSFLYMKQQPPMSPKASSCLLGVLLCSLPVCLAFVFSLISLPCLVSACPDIDFVDSPMGLGPCSFLRFSMIFKGLGALGFPGFVLESQRAWGIPMARVSCVSMLVRDSPLAGVFLCFGLQ